MGNVPDDVLQMVAEKGGIVMVNFFPYFLTDDYPARNATVQDVVAHINHIRAVAGVEHVGIGGDDNGINVTPVGLEDVSYDWTDEELAMVASQNLINTFRAAEEVRDLLASEGEQPDNSWIPEADLGSDTGCNSDFPPKP